MDIEHIIVFMLENHSFNRMLGVVPGVDGVDPLHPRSNPNCSNQPVFESPSAASRTLTSPSLSSIQISLRSKPSEPS